jgi:Uma2 family endonuclease
MAIATPTTKITYDEFMKLPDDNPYLELIGGVVIDRLAEEGRFGMPAPELEHQDTVSNLHYFIKTQARVRGGKVYFAPTDVKFDNEHTPQSDIFWIAPDGKCRPNQDNRLEGAPDFIAEILSPGTARRDRREKYNLYEKYGVREYWIVDPIAKVIEIYTLHEGKYVRAGVYGVGDQIESLLWGSIAMKEIFPDAE